MKMKFIGLFVAICPILFVTPPASKARVIEMQIQAKESPTFAGASFGAVGQYEKLTGIMKCEADPKHRLNSLVTNIDKAPKNARGLVEYDADFVIYKPIDVKKGNHKILFDTANRGGMVTLSAYNGGTPGNGFLMKEGYTIVAVGWEAPYPSSGVSQFLVGLGSRLPVGPALLRARLPMAVNADGSPVTGMSRELYYNVPDQSAPDGTGTFVRYLTYPAATLDKSRARLTVQATENDTPKVIEDWSYIDELKFTYKKPAGYIGTPLTEFIYPAKDPVVYGLGFAAIRDAISFLRYQTKDDAGNLNPLFLPEESANIRKTFAYGRSQTGRLIKTFVVDGFNEDEKGKIVFDGITTVVGASRKNWLNGQFSHPGDLFGYDQFPFTYRKLKDHAAGATGSNLDRCRVSKTCPKIMHIDSESEIWESGASLVVTNTEGTKDVKLPKDVRAYMFTGAKHGSGGSTDPGACQQLTNPLNYTPLARALLVALDKWVTDNIQPPATRYPRLSDGTLAPADKVAFPSIPAHSYGNFNLPAANYNGVFGAGIFRLDYSVQPPARLGEYKVYAMKVDRDGNGVAGVRLPAIEVPTGTYTGWNREKGNDARLCSATGSYFPFKATKAEREASGDPRISLQERYPSHEFYVKKVSDAAERLVRARFLLKEDARAIIDEAAASRIGN